MLRLWLRVCSLYVMWTVHEFRKLFRDSNKIKIAITNINRFRFFPFFLCWKRRLQLWTNFLFEFEKSSNPWSSQSHSQWAACGSVTIKMLSSSPPLLLILHVSFCFSVLKALHNLVMGHSFVINNSGEIRKMIFDLFYKIYTVSKIQANRKKLLIHTNVRNIFAFAVGKCVASPNTHIILDRASNIIVDNNILQYTLIFVRIYVYCVWITCHAGFQFAVAFFQILPIRLVDARAKHILTKCHIISVVAGLTVKKKVSPHMCVALVYELISINARSLLSYRSPQQLTIVFLWNYLST